ncbi:glycosyltransferase [Flavobacterium sp. Fl-318]|uniref:Glycosyltransferase n=1 Tax=Flavobacterium cupriresistens TaxID=2893885 RepID=A0ABU4RBZ4_9FLAO|nr:MULTISPECIES: glycosyltransferase [unclassified Flavobacterium]MDX6190115.1 glycosyltransferase [Flavobacterium sp. Fl-318]UFH42936.1 glycosyltransferase [Flavobacterium sp. F-323]
MATYNGSNYIKNQVFSILKQLKENDELVISDDGSTDNTLDIIRSFDDRRIVILNHKRNESIRKTTYPHYLVSSNYENALKHAKGDLIFLADQDDIWMNNKIEIMTNYLKNYSLVMSDCSVINESDVIFSDSFFSNIHLPRGLFLNITKPIYHGCCMAFRREVLDLALPFPRQTILHDTWIGVIAENFSDVKFIDDKLVRYRRHFNNSSFSGGKSKNSIYFKMMYRVKFLWQVIERIFSIKLNVLLYKDYKVS